MTLDTIWKIIHAELKKESRGNIIKPDEFSYLLQQCDLEYRNQQYEKWAASQTTIDSLRPFLVLDETITFSIGEEAVADLAKTYLHAVGARTDENVPIDIVDAEEWSRWAGDAVMAGSATYPVLTIDNDTLYISPDSITSVKFSYLKAPDNAPFFDYYTDANDEVQAMGENGTDYTLQASEVYRDGTTSGDVTSIMRELEWGDQDQANIVALILQKLGISLQSPEITQYAAQVQQQQNVA